MTRADGTTGETRSIAWPIVPYGDFPLGSLPTDGEEPFRLRQPLPGLLRPPGGLQCPPLSYLDSLKF
jgi:hypothetical protein